MLLHGGWEGHKPAQAAQFAADHLLMDYRVERADHLAALAPDVLAEVDLLVPIWTFGELTDAQEAALVGAVAGGMGLLAWHGFASAFLGSRLHKFVLGGQFMAHPGDDRVTYRVRFEGDDPLVGSLPDFEVTTEQYHLLVDPSVEVLATTTTQGEGMEWTAGATMPVAWKRRWGQGRVFYCALGHTTAVLAHPVVTTLLRRAALWATRAGAGRAAPAPAREVRAAGSRLRSPRSR